MSRNEVRELISIHAPTWGETLDHLVEEVVISLISIHAPTWGATDGKIPNRTMLDISIHAPTWGATEKRYRFNFLASISIHAPTWGATFWPTCSSSRKLFQSTHPRGVRLRPVYHLFDRFDFNPRTHVGCDTRRRPIQDQQQISIHAPTWGATR